MFAVALVAAAPRRRPSGHGLAHRDRGTFPFPLISKWIPEVGKAYGINITYSPTGSGAGIAAITARTVDFGASDAPLSTDQLDACKGCVVIPWALVGDVDPVQPAGPQRPAEAERADPREDLPRRDHDLERRGDQADQPKLQPAGHEDHAGLPLRRLRHDVQLHRLPVRRSARPGRASVGVNTSVSWPTGIGARGSSGVAGVVTKTPGALTYVDVAYALAEQAPVRVDPEQGRQVRDAGAARHQGGAVAAARRR